MNAWGFIDRALREPPWIIVLVVIAILISHAFKIVFELFAKRPQSNALFVTLETIVVIVLSYLAIHLYLERQFSKNETATYEPLVMTGLLVVFTCWSLRLYAKYKVRSRGIRR